MSDSLSPEAGEAWDVAWDVVDEPGAVWRPTPGKRGAFLLERLVSSGGRGVRVRRLGGSRAGEIRLTRFLRNPAVTLPEMVATAAAATGVRCAGRAVLAIQDTTVVSSAGGGGLYLHPVVAVDAGDGALLGLVAARFLTRTGGAKAGRRQRAVADKESGRWLEGAEAAARVCAGADRLTVVADREGDIFAAFARCPPGAELLVRCAHDRALEDGGRLFADLDAAPEAGRTDLVLPARKGCPKRSLRLAVRFRALTLARPRNGLREDLPARLRLTLVDLREVDPQPDPAQAGAAETDAAETGTAVATASAGRRERLHWRLLTTRPVHDLPEALAVAALYRRRWAIEDLFRTLKTKGFDIEALRIAEPAPRCNLVMASLIAAISVQQLVHARDGDPARDSDPGSATLRPVTDACDPADIPLIEALAASLEGRTARQKNPHPKRSLAYLAWVCARLGGWTGYYGKPGPLVMLNGWLDFQVAKRVAHAIRQRHNV